MTDNRSYINWWCGGNPVCHSRTGINLYNIRTIFPVDLESSYCNIQTIRPSGKSTRASSSCTVVRLSDLACVYVRVFFFNCGIVSPTVHIFRLSTRAVLCTSPTVHSLPGQDWVGQGKEPLPAILLIIFMEPRSQRRDLCVIFTYLIHSCICKEHSWVIVGGPQRK